MLGGRAHLHLEKSVACQDPQAVEHWRNYRDVSNAWRSGQQLNSN